MRELHPFRLAHRPRRVHDREVAHIVGEISGGTRLRGPTRDEILELEDPVVVPQILFTDRDHILQVGKVAQQLLEALQEIHAVPSLDGDHGARLGVPQLIAQIVYPQRGTHRHQHGAELRGGEGGDDPLHAVGKIHGDAITGSQPQFGEGCRQGGRVGVHLLVRPCSFPRRRQHALRMFLRTLGDQRGQRPRGCQRQSHLTP